MWRKRKRRLSGRQSEENEMKINRNNAPPWQNGGENRGIRITSWRTGGKAKWRRRQRSKARLSYQTARALG